MKRTLRATMLLLLTNPVDGPVTGAPFRTIAPIQTPVGPALPVPVAGPPVPAAHPAKSLFEPQVVRVELAAQRALAPMPSGPEAADIARRATLMAMACDEAFADTRRQPYSRVARVFDAVMKHQGTEVAAPADVMPYLRNNQGTTGLGDLLEAFARFAPESVLRAFNHASWLADAGDVGDPLLDARQFLAEQGLEGTLRDPTADEAAAVNAALYLMLRTTQDLQRTVVDPAKRAGKLSAPAILIAAGLLRDPGTSTLMRGIAFCGHDAEQRFIIVSDFGDASLPDSALRMCVTTGHELMHAQTLIHPDTVHDLVSEALRNRFSPDRIKEIATLMIEIINEGIYTQIISFHDQDTDDEKFSQTDVHFKLMQEESARRQAGHQPRGAAEFAAGLKPLLNGWLTDDPTNVERLKLLITHHASRVGWEDI